VIGEREAWEKEEEKSRQGWNGLAEAATFQKREGKVNKCSSVCPWIVIILSQLYRYIWDPPQCVLFRLLAAIAPWHAAI
jgi:hypothetical protein